MPETIRAVVATDPAAVFRGLTDAARLRQILAPGRIVGECAITTEAGGVLAFSVGAERHAARISNIEAARLIRWTRSVIGGAGATWEELITLEPVGGAGTQVSVAIGSGAPATEAPAWKERLEVLATLQALDAEQKRMGEGFKSLAALRRKLPPLEVPDYALHAADGSPLKLSAAFNERDEMLLVHNMGKGCVYCTLWADEFNGVCGHLADRCAFVLASPDEPAVMREFAASRGWKFRTLSTAGTSLARDLGFEPEPGRRWPGVSALSRAADGTITRTSWAHFGPHDGFCGVWPLLDMLLRGGNGWQPKYAYP